MINAKNSQSNKIISNEKSFYNQNLDWHLYLQKHKILNIYKREKYETFRKTIQATKKPRYKNFR